jgi:glycosyltransferase involved in cell wall biosynthesis
MKFSIVTPSYNQGQFLAETIESVLDQSGDFTIDYIIVDGGSNDDSLEIIKKYEALLQRGEWRISCSGVTFRWISKQDNGQTDALIKGFNLATGEILAWLNSDDTYLPGALQAATVYFTDHPGTGLVYGGARYIDASGCTISSYRTEAFDLIRLASTNIICQPSAFFSRKAFEAAGGLDESLDYVMDYDLWIRIGRCLPCQYIPQQLATYRLHESSKTISDATLRQNSEESLEVTLKHFGWAPLTRVYTVCRNRCIKRLPGFIAGNRIALALTAICCTVISSLRLNRGVNRDDLKLLNRDNFRKLIMSRLEIMTRSQKYK